MATLEQLMALPGAMAAFDFSGDGRLLDHKIGIERLINSETLELMAHMCAANIQIATLQAQGWRKMQDMNGFAPLQEFTLIGLEWSVAVRNPAIPGDSFAAVILENKSCNYDDVFAALDQ
jgi:roadblock/LC7 domain-containing protein